MTPPDAVVFARRPGDHPALRVKTEPLPVLVGQALSPANCFTAAPACRSRSSPDSLPRWGVSERTGQCGRGPTRCAGLEPERTDREDRGVAGKAGLAQGTA